MTNGVAYKVVRRLEDGTLVSSWVTGHEHYPASARQLTYVYGQIIMPPEYSDAGIFCHRTLESAVEGKDISHTKPCTVEVHEVYPMGGEIFYFGSKFSPHPKLVNYPAVLFGKKVADVEG